MLRLPNGKATQRGVIYPIRKSGKVFVTMGQASPYKLTNRGPSFSEVAGYGFASDLAYGSENQVLQTCIHLDTSGIHEHIFVHRILMHGYQSLPIRKQRPEFWHACVARPSEILATVNLSAKASPRCAFTSGQVIECNLREPGRPFLSCSLAATSRPKSMTSPVRKTWLASLKRRNHENDLCLL